MFFAVALALTVLCNLTLRENTAEASRPIQQRVSLKEALGELRKAPDNHELHSRIAELYLQEKNYRRAMFHLAESSRLIERYGD